MNNFMTSVVRRPITVLMSMVIVIALGLFGYSQMSRELLPEMELPYVTIVTPYVGASPEDVEEEVTMKIEAELKRVEGIENITSTSSENYSIIFAEFNAETDMLFVMSETRAKISEIQFEEGISTPSVERINLDMLPIKRVAISREDSNLIEDTIWLENEILPELESVVGISQVSVSGTSENVIEILLDTDEVEAEGLTNNEVFEIIEKQMPGDSSYMQINAEGEIVMIKSRNQELASVEELEEIWIADGVQLKDLVREDIKIINNDSTSYTKVNGQDAIVLSFTKQSGTDTINAIENVENKLEFLSGEHEGMNVIVLEDQAEYINTSISSVFDSLLIGGVLAIVILFMFLKDIRPTGIVALSIPIAVIGTFALMFVSGVSINVISMSALVIGIGMLVDNSIVVIENIYRMIRQGATKKEAAIKGGAQVAGAITASTLTTIAVFSPLLMIDHIMLQMLNDLVLTIVYSLLASLIIALTLVPTLSARTFKEGKEISGGLIKTLREYYEIAMKKLFKQRILTLVIVLVLFGISLPLGMIHGMVLSESESEGIVAINIQMEKGTDRDTTVEYLMEVEQLMLDEYEGKVVLSELGGSSSMSIAASDFTQATVTVDFAHLNDLTDDIKDIEKKLEELDKPEELEEQEVGLYTTFGSVGSSDSSISIKVSGSNSQTLREIADELVLELQEVSGLDEKSISNGIPESGNEVVFTVDQEKAIKEGLYVSNVQDSYNVFNSLMFGQMLTTSSSDDNKVVVGGIDYDLTTEGFDFSSIIGKIYDPSFKWDEADYGMGITDSSEIAMIQMFGFMAQDGDNLIDAIKIIPVLSEATINEIDRNSTNENIIYSYSMEFDSEGKVVGIDYVKYDLTDPLNPVIVTVSEVVNLGTITEEIVYQGRSSQILRDGNNKYVQVTATLDGSVIEQTVNDEINNIIAEYEAPTGYTLSVGGSTQDFSGLLSDLVIAILVAVIIVYLIMVIQFQNFVYPFIVLSTIPLAMTGGMFAIAITFNKFDMMAMIGLIILVGVVVNTGIVLIDYINKLREEENMELYDSLILAGKTRLRPILMTALTTIFGLSVMALGIGEGGNQMTNMAITAIGGLIYATILSMFIVPITYSLINDFKGTKRDSQL